MKTQLIAFCILIFTMSFAGNSYAGLPEHDVFEDKKEVWFIPTLLIQNYFFYSLQGRTPGTVETRIEPYAEASNRKKEKELQQAYPNFRIRSYAMNLGDVFFTFVDAPVSSVSYSPSMGGWWATSYKQVPSHRVQEVADILKNAPGVKVTTSIYRNDHFVEIEPEVEYQFESMTY